MLDLVSFLIQICRQGQHLELLGYKNILKNKHTISDQRCTIISANNYQLQLNFVYDMVTCLK
jgi:hypothetical protein